MRCFGILCLALVAVSCTTVQQDLGSNTCSEDQCGPALGMPNSLCDDGKTTAGPTGRCLAQADGTCGWEVLSCPGSDGGAAGTDAGVCACTGTRPMIANVQCSDGSMGGPVCSTHADGTCSWEVRKCPNDACPALGCLPNCPNGVQQDSNGCDTCECAPAFACDTVACLIKCEYGLLKDELGCDLCQCAPAPSCNPVTCDLYCANGFAKDATGCEICQCAQKCATDTDCPQLELCMKCGDGCSDMRCVQGTCQWVCDTAQSDGGSCTCTGTRPLVANVVCADGTAGGPICALLADGSCSWQVRACPS